MMLLMLMVRVHNRRSIIHHRHAAVRHIVAHVVFELQLRMLLMCAVLALCLVLGMTLTVVEGRMRKRMRD
jgi:hypothetical protein